VPSSLGHRRAYAYWQRSSRDCVRTSLATRAPAGQGRQSGRRGGEGGRGRGGRVRPGGPGARHRRARDQDRGEAPPRRAAEEGRGGVATRLGPSSPSGWPRASALQRGSVRRGPTAELRVRGGRVALGHGDSGGWVAGVRTRPECSFTETGTPLRRPLGFGRKRGYARPMSMALVPTTSW